MSGFKEVTLPDGRIVRFPQGMTREEMAIALNSLSAQASTPAEKPDPRDIYDIANNSHRMSGRAFATGVADGSAFGFGDNLGAVAAGVDSAIRGNGFSDGYSGSLQMARQEELYDNYANPGSRLSGNIAGATLPALASAPLAMGKTVLGTMGRGAAIGATEGAMQGAGASNGQNTTAQTIRGALIGGMIGGAAPAIVGAVGAAKRGITDLGTGIFNVANQGKANRAIARAFQGSGRTQSEIDDALNWARNNGLPEYRMMDALGVAGQRQASGIARAGGDAGAEIARFLEQRQLGQGDRIGGFVEDAFGVRGTTAAQTTDALTAARSAAADTAYTAARGNAAPVDVTGALGVIDARSAGMQGGGIVGDGIDARLAGYRARLAGNGAGLGPDVTGAQLSDFNRVLGLKQSIQDDIGAAVRAGRDYEARELGKLVTELDAALEASSDMYRAANDGFRQASQVIGAVDEGASMAMRGRAADTVPRFGSMTTEQQAAARVGYGDRLLERLEAVTAPTANRAGPLRSEKRVTEAAAMAIDPQTYAQRLGFENDMWATQNRVMGGSRTADNLADQSAIDGLAGGALGVARSAGNLQFGDMAARVAGMIEPLARGQTESTRSLIAKALMSNDPVAALAPALRQDMSAAAKAARG
ncbi:MAG: hypothetical protein U5N55_12650 [Cypionkella sp.]|nr:hypothetical protein [Cypionkella sp.]